MTPCTRHEVVQFRASLALYARLLAYVRAEWPLVLLTVLAMLGTTLVALGRPWPMQVIVDSVLGTEPTPAWITTMLGALSVQALLMVSVALMLAALLIGGLLALSQQYCAQLLGQRMVLRLRCDLYAKVQRLTLRFHDRSTVGDLVYRLTEDAAALQDIVTHGFVPLAIQLITAAAIASTIFVLDARLGLVAMSVVPLLVFWTVWFSERLRRDSRGLASAESTLYATTTEVLGGIRAVKSFTTEEIELKRFEARARMSQRAYVRVMTLSTAGTLVTEAVAGLGTVAVVLLGAYAVLERNLTVGELLVFIAYLHALYGPTTQVAASTIVIQRSGASIERVIEILEEEDEHAKGAGHRLETVAGRLSYRSVSYGYDEARFAVRDVSLDIAPGEVVAFVGRSGAGKTTLLSLLLRFYAPEAGRILLDGVDIAALDLRWLRRQIALVLQDPIIFSCSLAENIAYGRPGVTQAEIAAASEAAGLHDFVTELPEGYDTTVGERGVRLSSGQRQRLAIARAFLKDAPILILDEPTSNLDATTERHIFGSLERLATGRTTLVISHRLVAAQRADRIVVIARGRVVEQGTHRDLLRANGAYARLYHDQTRGRPPSPASEADIVESLDRAEQRP